MRFGNYWLSPSSKSLSSLKTRSVELAAAREYERGQVEVVGDSLLEVGRRLPPP
jgi:hypothetical protein